MHRTYTLSFLGGKADNFTRAAFFPVERGKQVLRWEMLLAKENNNMSLAGIRQAAAGEVSLDFEGADLGDTDLLPDLKSLIEEYPDKCRRLK